VAAVRWSDLSPAPREALGEGASLRAPGWRSDVQGEIESVNEIVAIAGVVLVPVSLEEGRGAVRVLSLRDGGSLAASQSLEMTWPIEIRFAGPLPAVDQPLPAGIDWGSARDLGRRLRTGMRPGCAFGPLALRFWAVDRAGMAKGLVEVPVCQRRSGRVRQGG